MRKQTPLKQTPLKCQNNPHYYFHYFPSCWVISVGCKHIHFGAGIISIPVKSRSFRRNLIKTVIWFSEFLSYWHPVGSISANFLQPNSQERSFTYTLNQLEINSWPMVLVIVNLKIRFNFSLASSWMMKLNKMRRKRYSVQRVIMTL